MRCWDILVYFFENIWQKSYHVQHFFVRQVWLLLNFRWGVMAGFPPKDRRNINFEGFQPNVILNRFSSTKLLSSLGTYSCRRTHHFWIVIVVNKNGFKKWQFSIICHTKNDNLVKPDIRHLQGILNFRLKYSVGVTYITNLTTKWKMA